jgi:Uma2 family endonuclease
MATISNTLLKIDPPYDNRINYPTSDGRPMGETDLHRQDMLELIESLKLFYESQRVYVSGNLLIYYERGNKRKHVSPDVFVVKGIDPHPRDNYLLWNEGKGPDVVIEVTSASTRKEDVDRKYKLYRDVLEVREYFLFDPRSEFLNPSLQGHRLVDGRYIDMEVVSGRLPSDELGLHLEQHGSELRLWDPNTDRWLPTPDEARRQADAARQQADAARQEAERDRQREVEARQRAEAEVERLKQEVESLRRGKSQRA